jgi:hypothetical protein
MSGKDEKEGGKGDADMYVEDGLDVVLTEW